MPKLTTEQFHELMNHIDAAAREFVMQSKTPWDNVALASAEVILTNPDLDAMILDRLRAAGILSD